MDSKRNKSKVIIRYYYDRVSRDVGTFLKWIVLAILTGLVVGGASSIFAGCIKWVTEYRNNNIWVFMLLPIVGVAIVFMYQIIDPHDGGTNQVLSTIRSRGDVPLKAAPLIFVSTLLTHLTGGSAGREGASIQFGGSIGNWLGKLVKLDEFDHHVMIMCGMSAAFAAVFGTPMAAAVFAMEVVSVGVMYYAAMLPCVVASIIAAEFATGMGISPETFSVTRIPALTVETGFKMAIISVGCAMVSIMFCIALKFVAKIYGKYLKNLYIRVFVAGCVVIAITMILNTKDYMGAGNELIARAIETGQARPLDFLWKMILTAVTMRAGYRGGEIVPAFSVGATFGCVAGQLLGFQPELAAAAGMVALFCGVTNCPITSMLISFELFGFSGVAYYLIAISVSYSLSGYYSLYKDQTIVYSKYKAKYINKRTR
ncbi:chloride channel protein [Eubacterium sp.]